MKLVTLMLGLLVAFALGCSKDGDKDKAGPTKKVTETGVSAVPASELGPDKAAGRTISVTTKSEEARAAFESGRDLFENIRHGEAVEKLEKAIELDPEFAQAHALLGFATPDKEGLAEIERAVELSKTLPPAEHLYVKSFLLRRTGKRDEYVAAIRKLADMAAGDPRAHIALALVQQDLGELDAAQQELERAIALGPKVAHAYNLLAYLHANRGELDKAAEVAAQYAALRPDEPNPQDSLGEILMMGGKLDQAEASFRRALEIEPSFTIAWEGVAMTKVYRADWPAAIEAFGKLQAGADTPKEQHKALKEIAWTQAASGDLDAALATLGKIDGPSGSMMKVELLMAVGKPEQAQKALDAHVKSLQGKGDEANMELAWAAIPQVEISVERGDIAAAQKKLQEIEQKASSVENEYYAFAVEYARGVVALGEGNGDAALAHFDKISNPLLPYGTHARWRKVQALEKAGKQDQATKLFQELKQTYRRDAYHAFVRASLSS